MTPSLFHVAPFGISTSHNDFGGPLPMVTIFNRCSAKKPIERPSGDQNGHRPSCVPEISSESFSASERNHKTLSPLELITAKTTDCPFGEIATDGTTRFSGTR